MCFAGRRDPHVDALASGVRNAYIRRVAPAAGVLSKAGATLSPFTIPGRPAMSAPALAGRLVAAGLLVAVVAVVAGVVYLYATGA